MASNEVVSLFNTSLFVLSGKMLGAILAYRPIWLGIGVTN